ncbi:MAG: MmgE/PrpD family protein [Betaproteobacteria bacterium]|nr:MmgE/PrpD family protein [Betaproteobacteria bacterium]
MSKQCARWFAALPYSDLPADVAASTRLRILDAVGLALAASTGRFGETWESRNISFKPYPAAHVIHSFLDAILHLYRKEGPRAEQIERIICPENASCTLPGGQVEAIIAAVARLENIDPVSALVTLCCRAPGHGA